MDTKTDSSRHVNRYGLGAVAMSERLPFPDHARLTAIEILTFFPNSIHTHSFVYRFVSNGATRNAIWSILNTGRDLPDELKLNCVGSYMYKAMTSAGYVDWTVKSHKFWHDESAWDGSNLVVAGIRPFDHFEIDLPTFAVPFRQLSAGVKSMPRNFDALDLTRMIQHCADHPAEPWMYPQDYTQLLDRLGGPVDVCSEHFDRAVFLRYQSTKPPRPRIWSQQELQTAMHALDAQPKARNKRQRSVITVGGVPDHMRARGARSQNISQRMVRQERREGGVPVEKTTMAGVTPEMDSRGHPVHVEESVAYSRRPAEYVAPPAKMGAPPVEVVRIAFAAEHMFGERDEYSAYAFGGPRQAAPYRMLHHIGEADPGDGSGWGENLRWAFEQRACFWHTAETEGWNESPEHMKRIAEARKEQEWASDELLALINEYYRR